MQAIERDNLEDVLSSRGNDMQRCATACLTVQGRSRNRLSQMKSTLQEEMKLCTAMLGEDGTAEYLDDATAMQLVSFRESLERAHTEIAEAYEKLTQPSL